MKIRNVFGECRVMITSKKGSSIHTFFFEASETLYVLVNTHNPSLVAAQSCHWRYL